MLHMSPQSQGRSGGRQGTRVPPEMELTRRREVTRDEAKEKQILDAAQKVFALYGFRKATIGDVVREAGVARATLYKYFPAKDDLFRAVIEELPRAAITTTGRRVRNRVLGGGLENSARPVDELIESLSESGWEVETSPR